MGYGPIAHFTDIEAWKLARELRIAVYSLIEKLPTEEKYNLASQLRRAAISCTANIAEGYGRFHFQENIQFCRISRGSMYEIQDQLITCLDNEHIAKEEYETIWDLAKNAIRVLDGYIRYLKKQQSTKRAKNNEEG